MGFKNPTTTLPASSIAGLGALALLDTVGSAQINTGAVGSAQIADGAVGSTELATGAVIADKLAAASVSFSKLVDQAVTNDKLAALAVTSDKIAAAAVIADKIAAGSIAANKIAAGAILADKIAAGAISTLILNGEIIRAGQVANNQSRVEISNGGLKLIRRNSSGIDSTRLELGTFGIPTGLKIMDSAGKTVWQADDTGVTAAGQFIAPNAIQPAYVKMDGNGFSCYWGAYVPGGPDTTRVGTVYPNPTGLLIGSPKAELSFSGVNYSDPGIAHLSADTVRLGVESTYYRYPFELIAKWDIYGASQSTLWFEGVFSTERLKQVNKPVAQCTFTGNYAHPDNVLRFLNIQATDSRGDITVSGSRVTIAVGGRYQVSAQVRWSGTAGSAGLYTNIRKNGSATVAQAYGVQGANNMTVQITPIWVDLVAGDYLEWGTQAASGITLQAGVVQTRLLVMWDG